jgi:putative ABC transport system substrate-binding protein
MIPRLLLSIIIFLTLIGFAHACRVAIFDFDDRLQESCTVAKFIQKRLTEQIGDIEIEQFSGKADEALSVRLLTSLDQQGYDLIISVTSDALILAHHTVTRTPLLFTNVNNPLFLGFRTLGAPGGNISGVSYYVAIVRQLMAFKTIQPNLSRPGFLFDRFNKSRKVELPESRDACRHLGMRFEFALVKDKSDLKQQVKSLIDKGVDAVITTSSGTIYENIAQFIDICDSAAIPVYSFSRQGVTHGAVAALATDYYRIADELLIPMALKVLQEGISPGRIPMAFLKEGQMVVNAEQIQKLKLHVPPNTISTTVEIHDPSADQGCQ